MLEFQWDIIGHDKALDQLEADVLNVNVAHAYLFQGPGHIGKLTVACHYATVLQCPQKGNDDCSSCQAIAHNAHPDVVLLEDDGHAVKIEAVRKIIEKLSLTSDSAHKIVIIQNIERLTLPASNALLKTLEEPAGNTVFLLTTSAVHSILPTIVSRSRSLTFQPLPQSQVEGLLRKKCPHLSEEKVATVSELAMGCPGKALQFGLQENENSSLQLYDQVREVLVDSSRADQFLYVQSLVDQVKKMGHQGLLEEFLDICMIIARKNLLEDIQTDHDTASSWIDRLEVMADARHMLRQNVNAQLALEHVMLAL